MAQHLNFEKNNKKKLVIKAGIKFAVPPKPQLKPPLPGVFLPGMKYPKRTHKPKLEVPPRGPFVQTYTPSGRPRSPRMDRATVTRIARSYRIHYDDFLGMGPDSGPELLADE